MVFLINVLSATPYGCSATVIRLFGRLHFFAKHTSDLFHPIIPLHTNGLANIFLSEAQPRVPMICHILTMQ